MRSVVVVLCLFTADCSSAAGLFPSVQRAVDAVLPEFVTGQVARGQLIEGGPAEVAVIATRQERQNENWPMYSYVVLREVSAGGHEVVGFSCPDTYNPVGGHDIEIRGNSLFVQATMGGMESAETRRDQYRFDGKGMRQIGSEYNYFYNGDDPAVAREREVRRSWNLLTGRIVEFTAAGERETKGQVPAPEYLECKHGLAEG